MAKSLVEHNKKDKSKLDAIFKKSESIILTSHKHPDDDSISSILAAYYYLTKKLHLSDNKIKIIYTGEKSDRWAYFKNYDKVQFTKDLVLSLKGGETLVILDADRRKRISNLENL